MAKFRFSAFDGGNSSDHLEAAGAPFAMLRPDDWGAIDPANAAALGRGIASRAMAEAADQAADFPAVFKLANLDGENGFSIRLGGGERPFGAGHSVSSAGDVNGDGFDDIIVGAPYASPGGDVNVGRSYVVFGHGGGFDARFELSSLDGTNGFRLDGTGRGSRTGYSVSDAGDVNGDGFDDIIIGARDAGANGDNDSGKSYVVFGKADGFAASINLATLDGSNGFRLDGDDTREYSGFAVSGAGDVNGDGFDDILVGAPGSNPRTGRDAGSTYLVYGKADGFAATVDLADLDGTDGFRFIGVDAYDESGHAISSAGDVNGDGLEDILIGAYEADAGEARNAGVSYVVFGDTAGFSSDFTLVDLDGTNGFRIDGVTQFDRSGRAVSSAGDVNGDGFDDIIIGADYAGPDGKTFAGASYVVFGKEGGFDANISLAALDGSNGFRLDGLDPGDASGHSVSSAGDINGDGFDDILIGAYRADPGVHGAGETYVVFGHRGGFAANIDLAALDGSNGFRVDGTARVDYTGSAASSAGDVNGDGFDDILIGSIGASNTNGSYVIFGRAPEEAVRRVGSDADQTIRGGAFDDVLSGKRGDDVLDGGGGADRLHGGKGEDRLIATEGGDLMWGDRGTDRFVLSDNVGGADRARIMDFGRGPDRFEIDADDFGGGLAPGALNPNAFLANTNGEAGDAGDRFIYNTANGQLLYDADGSGGGASVLIAQLDGAPAVTAADFIVV